jgi:uncharacterized protein (DUF302 family)
METSMGYYFGKPLEMPFAKWIEHLTASRAGKGFGVLTTIDVRATLKKKLDVEFRPDRILGARNPEFAYKALQRADAIGTMMACNVVAHEVARPRRIPRCRSGRLDGGGRQTGSRGHCRRSPGSADTDHRGFLTTVPKADIHTANMRAAGDEIESTLRMTAKNRLNSEECSA